MTHANPFSSRTPWILGATALLALTACGGDDLATSATSPAEAIAGDPPAEADDAGASPSAIDEPGLDPTAGTGQPSVAPDRLLIIDVTIGVEVTDVAAAVSDVIAAADRHDGQVYGSDVRLGDPDRATARIVVKLPPDQVEAAITEMSTLGRLVGRVQGTEDVTDRVTDLETRITTQQQSVARVQQLLAEATNLGEVVQLEAELTTRQTVLEELLAQQRNLANATALATLTIDLSVGTAVEASPGDASDRSVGEAFASGGRAFLLAVTAVVIFLGYVAPFLAVGLVLAAVTMWIRRGRARRNRSAAPLLPPAPDADRRTSEPDSAGAPRT